MGFLKWLSLSVLALTGCAWHANSPKVAVTDEIISEQRSFNNCQSVAVFGPITTQLVKGSQCGVMLRGHRSDMGFVKTENSNGHLIVRAYPHQPFQTTIMVRNIHDLEQHGDGTLTGQNITAGPMNILVKNKGQVKLSGQIYVRKLTVENEGYAEISGMSSSNLQLVMKDNGRASLSGKVNLSSVAMGGESSLNLYWINSPQLSVKLKDKAHLKLAGLVDRLAVDTWDRAYFEGRYLRAKRAFAKSHDDSVIDIAAIEHQHTLAIDRSNIYYYNLPELKTNFMDDNGAVLDLRPWDAAFWKDESRYNKLG